MDFIRHWSSRTEIRALRLVSWTGLSRSKFYYWKERYGKANEHNGLVPRDHWLEAWEKQAIIQFHWQYPLEGYRRLTFMMLDRDIVAVSPAMRINSLKSLAMNCGPLSVIIRALALGYFSRAACSTISTSASVIWRRSCQWTTLREQPSKIEQR